MESFLLKYWATFISEFNVWKDKVTDYLSNKHSHQLVCPLLCHIFLHLGLDAAPILRDEITERWYCLGILCFRTISLCPVEWSRYTIDMMSWSLHLHHPNRTGERSAVLPQAETPCLQYNIWFSPYSANDSSPATVIIIMWTGLLTSCNDHPADSGSCTHHAHKSHLVLTSAHRQLSVLPYLDCTPPIYCFAMIDVPSAIKNRHRRKLRDPKWTHSMSLFSGGFKGQREFKTSYQHKSSPCPSEAAHSTGGINYRLNRTVGSILKICSPLYHYYFVALAL